MKKDFTILPKHLEMLYESVSKIVDLTRDEFSTFADPVKYQPVKKKALVLREGDICSFTIFIVKGCLRYFYTVNGDERTGQFFFENSWYTDYGSFLSGTPSRQNIEALEKCELLILDKRDLERMYQQNPKFERFGRLMAERAYLGVRNRTESLTNQSAEDRYLTLMKERPKVFERIPQHYIASYLGIQPQSLSRIRKRILGTR